MIRNFCLLLLTVFFICKAADVVSSLLAKDKITAVCNSDDSESDDSENEKSEVEKINDDQQLHQHSLTLNHNLASVILRVTFSYSVPTEHEIFENLFSPPPELV